MNHFEREPAPRRSPRIRSATAQDYGPCADLWLRASILGHPFVDPKFWQFHRDAMELEYLPTAETRTAKNSREELLGFSSLRRGRIEALFVDPGHWRSGIGRALMLDLQCCRDELTLSVYEANTQGRAFYRSMGFQNLSVDRDPATGQPEILMEWRRF